MKLALLFAKRYLLSPKSHSVINLISWVSVVAVAVPVAAMVILLSVFNGFDTMVKDMYKNFDPDLMVTPTEGKFFDNEQVKLLNLNDISGVEGISYFIEDNALFGYGDRQYIGVMRGVDSMYRHIVPIDSLVTIGDFDLMRGDSARAVIGQGLCYSLGIQTYMREPVTVFVPRKNSSIFSLPGAVAYTSEKIDPIGVFTMDADTDSRYMLVPYRFATQVLGVDGQSTGVMVKVKSGSNVRKVQADIQAVVGDDFNVKTRYQQKQSYYLIMQYEKWGIYFIALLVLLIASFSIIGSLAMLIIDKKNDIFTLRSIGFCDESIRRVFISEGVLITAIGAIGGAVLGILVCMLQQEFGFVKLSGETFLVDHYPVDMRIMDFVTIFGTVGFVGYVMSWLTVRVMTKVR